MAVVLVAAVAAVAGCGSSGSGGESCREYCQGRGFNTTYDTQSPDACINWIAGTQKRRGGWFFDVDCCCYER